MTKILLAIALLPGLALASDFRLDLSKKPMGNPSKLDVLAKNLQVVPGSGSISAGSDHILLDNARSLLFVFGISHEVHSVDLTTGETKFWGKTPSIVGGVRFNPTNNNELFLCMTKEEGTTYPAEVKNGLFRAHLDFANSTIGFEPIVTSVFKDRPSKGPMGDAFSLQHAPSRTFDDLSAESDRHRPMGICDDLIVSKDGQRVYFVEPYENKGGGFGDESNGKTNQEQILMSYQKGKLWLADLETQNLRLLGSNLAFPDGVTIERFDSNGKEQSLLLTELSRYRLVRLDLTVPKAKFEAVYENLPGMPNALERDERGRIYMAFNKLRTTSLNVLYNFPVFKKLVKRAVLKLPKKLKPVPLSTGFAILEPAASMSGYRVHAYYAHDGKTVTGITHVLPDPDNGNLYFSFYDRTKLGLYFLPPTY